MSPPLTDRRRPAPARAARGAAALIVVMVLFFIVSLVAAYTSRNMIFEQRTSVNQARATQAHELAEAGLEWALTKLNAGLIDGNCQTDVAGASTFRDRYLTFAANGDIAFVGGAAATCAIPPGGDWVCSCPAAGATIPAAGPAFRIWFELDRGTARQNLIRVTAAACTEGGVQCLANPQDPEVGKGNAIASVNLGLKGAVDTIPAAAVTAIAPSTAASGVTLTGGTQLLAINGWQTGTGVAVHSGGELPAAGLTVKGAPGTPEDQAKVGPDLSLSTQAGTGGLRNSADAGACPAGDPHIGCSFNRVFAGVFGMPRATWREQPALVECTGVCDGAVLADLAARNPRSAIRVIGNATLDANLGTVAAPVALVVEGDVTLSGAGTVVTGLVYGTSGVWTVNGNPRVDGAIFSESAATFGGGGLLEVRYEPVVLARLRSRHGSFVRLPGSWRDFPQ